MSTMAHRAAEVVSGPDAMADLFKVLDEVARGLAREAALAPEERAARTESILAWFAPRYAVINATVAAAPCPVPWSIHLADPAADSPDPEPHPCADCFTQRYRAGARSRDVVVGSP
jgi:hypothetical protein